jgi:diadenylate cyclase
MSPNPLISSERKTDMVSPPSRSKKFTKLEILKKLSSGTPLREGLDDIVKGGLGAIVVVTNSESSKIFKGGFKINSKFTSKRLAELAKMDGAIILSEDFKKILYANTLLTPDGSIASIETGIRHQAAERTAKQIGGLVIAVSERKNTITMYYGNSRYVLQNSEDLLRRATETLQILEKQRDVFNELLTNMNLLELSGLVSVADVCKILERLEVIRKMSEIINQYIVELGSDGIIVRMRMREITRGIEKEQDFIIKDYFKDLSKVRQYFDSLTFDELLDLERIAMELFDKPLETSISPKGHRILGKITLTKEEVSAIIKRFENLEGVLNASEEDLKKVVGNNAVKLQKELSTLREHVMLGKKI